MSDENFIGLQYLPECVTAVEMETLDSCIRLETNNDSLGRVFIEHKESGTVLEFSPMFCCEQFQIVAQHCEFFRDKALAEEATSRKLSNLKDQPDSSKASTDANEAKDKKPAARIVKGDKVTPDLMEFALR